MVFSIKMRVPVAIWDGKSSRAKGRTPEAVRINRYLETIHTRLISIYQNLTEAGEIVTPHILRDEFLGLGAKNTTLLTIFKEFNERQEKLIGIDITQSTFNKFDLTAPVWRSSCVRNATADPYPPGGPHLCTRLRDIPEGGARIVAQLVGEADAHLQTHHDDVFPQRYDDA